MNDDNQLAHNGNHIFSPTRKMKGKESEVAPIVTDIGAAAGNVTATVIKELAIVGIHLQVYFS